MERDHHCVVGLFGERVSPAPWTEVADEEGPGKKVCPSSRHRPPGKQCDEYPFASTWQGASTGGGQFSWRMINATQNEDGGRALKNFYGYNRIIEKGKFLVWIK
ncbi:NucA/NucB deoxyribonuclease domain-containing protein [Streptomyces mirabilis]